MFPKLNNLVSQILDYKAIKFDLTDDNTFDYQGIVKYYGTHGKLIIWSGGSDCTIFGKPEDNYKFRAWHDLHHILNGYDFSQSGEYKTYMSQMKDIMTYADSWPQCKLFGRIIDIEINGQVDYQRKHGYFPEDQRAFMEQQLARGEYHDAAYI